MARLRWREEVRRCAPTSQPDEGGAVQSVPWRRLTICCNHKASGAVRERPMYVQPAGAQHGFGLRKTREFRESSDKELIDLEILKLGGWAAADMSGKL